MKDKNVVWGPNATWRDKLSCVIGCRACGNCQWDSEPGECGSILAEWQMCEAWQDGYNSDSELDKRMSDKVMDDESWSGSRESFPYTVIPIECLIHKKYITKKKYKEQMDAHWEKVGKQIDKEVDEAIKKLKDEGIIK